jgi:hypothetical protein
MTREEVAGHALTCARKRERTVIALDFAFSLPRWYMSHRRWRSARDAWTWARKQQDQNPDRWHRELPEPFWGTGIRRKPVGAFGDATPEFRSTEIDSRRPGVRPLSTFQIGGIGAVGAQSMLGMVQLDRLAEAGCHIWPFDDPGWPLVLEIFPRLLVRQLCPGLAGSRGEKLRAQLVEGLPPEFLGGHRDKVLSNHDAFDAAVSAWALWLSRNRVVSLVRDTEAPYSEEGRIWHLPEDLLGAASPK